jgi:hypothetical protein
MKKLILLLILILSFNYPQAQIKPFIGVSFHNKWYSLQGGVKNDNLVALAGYSKPLSSAINPTLYFGSIGYEISISAEEKDGYNITPLIGLSSFSYLYQEVQTKGVALITGIEVGKDFNDGRLFISGNYCKGLFIGAGIKIFIY